MKKPHGGNVYEIAASLGCTPEDILDYSASINPLGPPPGLREALDHCFPMLQHYPDIHCHALIEALSTRLQLGRERIALGNGSTELIYWMPRALGIRTAAVAVPTFTEYRRAFEIQGVELREVPTSPDNGFQPGVDQLETAWNDSRPDAFLFTNPGSPSGIALSPEVKEWILEKSRSDAWCIVDEVFIDFCAQESLAVNLPEAPRLVLVRSMTKFYGIPGLRLGYLLASGDVVAGLGEMLPPWSLNTLAQAAGVYCLGQENYRAETLRLIDAERDRMAERLDAVKGLTVFRGRANYLLVKLGEGLQSALDLKETLIASEKILIRPCGSFEGLSDRYFRVAVRLQYQNDRLLRGIERCIAAG